MGRKAHTKEGVWKFVKCAGPNECWEWQGYKNPRGYGEYPIKKKSYRAHRVVYEVANGVELPRLTVFSKDVRIVMHACDNPGCCNPRHLKLASPKENTQDMIKKGRRWDNTGLKHPHAILTADLVRRIRSDRDSGMYIREIQEKYGLSFSVAREAALRLSYKDVQ